MASTLPQSRVHTQRQASNLSRALRNLSANRSALRVLSLVLFFGILQFLCVIGFKFFINFQLVPSPVEVAEATVEFFLSEPGVHLRSSVVRVLAGFSVASVLGIVMGMFIGWF
ncbi:MAG: ABC transporter permease, partial [Cyanobacteria bacterium J06598_3]